MNTQQPHAKRPQAVREAITLALLRMPEVEFASFLQWLDDCEVDANVTDEDDAKFVLRCWNIDKQALNAFCE